MLLTEWAARWNLPPGALADLRANVLHIDTPVSLPDTGKSEAFVQSAARLDVSKLWGGRAWRNNVGAVHDEETGSFLRYGLCNDSSQVNKVLKSADLIGIRPVVITQAHVGHVIGQFVSIECKAPGWKWAGTEREVAQGNWATLIASLGGDARFVNGAGQL